MPRNAPNFLLHAFLRSFSRPIRSGTHRTVWKKQMLITLIFAALYFGLCAAIVWAVIGPHTLRSRRTPATFGLPKYEDAEFISADGVKLRGWFLPPSGNAKGVVICCHGVSSTKVSMLQATAILHHAGYAVLVFDFRARGTSGGKFCTLGYRETEDLLAAIAYVQARPDVGSLPLGLLGNSLGGAVALMGAARCPAVKCVIAESAFVSLDHAVDNHFRAFLWKFAPVLSVPTRWIGEQSIGQNCADIAPIQVLDRISPRPILLIHDGKDSLCPASEADALQQKAGAACAVWTVPNAYHIKAVSAQPDAYAQHITAFFDANL